MKKSSQQSYFESARLGHLAYLMSRPGGKRMDIRSETLRSIYDRRCNLSASVLSGVNLIAALMQDCDLSMADLFTADLSFSDRNGRNLRRIDERGARFDNALLRGADLRGGDFCPGHAVY